MAVAAATIKLALDTRQAAVVAEEAGTATIQAELSALMEEMLPAAVIQIFTVRHILTVQAVEALLTPARTTALEVAEE